MGLIVGLGMRFDSIWIVYLLWVFQLMVFIIEQFIIKKKDKKKNSVT